MKTMITMLTCLFLSASAYSHGDHNHGDRITKCKKKTCTKDEIKSGVVEHVIPEFIGKKKIAASWTKAEFKSMEERKYGKKVEWVLVYYNATEKPKKQKLYVFVTGKGYLSGINHTGK
ncbi:MAG: hypothetical protein CMP10_14305 [Zetaproteobacteria bacterium]|nr:hypothetical protein [Pseudobdellovibrionaceae bacterium]|tara:strand:+ start:308 stop:661 length:354 start_codon:yes stop_codon:yes gene_type:complete